MPRFAAHRHPDHRSPRPRVRRRRPRARPGALTVLATAVLAAVGGVTGATLTAGVSGAAPSPTVVTARTTSTWGRILVLGNGTTVYRLSADAHDHSTCRGTCAAVWPPVLLARGQHTAVGHGVSGLGSIPRPGGGRQVTYRGVPLYRFTGDHHPGQVGGNVKDAWGRWWVVGPAHPLAVPVVHHSSGTTPTTHPSSWSTGGSGGGY